MRRDGSYFCDCVDAGKYARSIGERVKGYGEAATLVDEDEFCSFCGSAAFFRRSEEAKKRELSLFRKNSRPEEAQFEVEDYQLNGHHRNGLSFQKDPGEYL